MKEFKFFKGLESSIYFHPIIYDVNTFEPIRRVSIDGQMFRINWFVDDIHPNPFYLTTAPFTYSNITLYDFFNFLDGENYLIESIQVVDTHEIIDSINTRLSTYQYPNIGTSTRVIINGRSPV